MTADKQIRHAYTCEMTPAGPICVRHASALARLTYISGHPGVQPISARDARIKYAGYYDLDNGGHVLPGLNPWPWRGFESERARALESILAAFKVWHTADPEACAGAVAGLVGCGLSDSARAMLP